MRAVWSRRRKLSIEPVCREFPHDAARVKLVDVTFTRSLETMTRTAPIGSARLPA